ncbi:hypothetical protein [Streptomyces noursei]|uniref:hypothetical protein n=1 Tax=Streptomyces noursei TaxID=1971 RepID=UPI0011AED92D|nr:hypothetical protein [Streptomyces noursei]
MDAAKRLIPHLYPEWTDHNVSDPGITLVEACAARIDELSYRLGRVPGPVREAFLRLLAPPRRPAIPARTLLTFTRKPGPAAAIPLVIPAGTQITTDPGTGEKIIFTLQEEVNLPPAHAFVYGKAQDVSNMPPANSDGGIASYKGTLQADADTRYDTGEPSPQTSAIILVADPGPDKLLTLHLSLQSHDPGHPGAALWQIATKTKEGWGDLQSLGTSSPDPFAGPTQVRLKVPGNRQRYQATITLDSPSSSSLFAPADVLALRLTIGASTAGKATWSISSLHPAEAVSAPAPALQIVPFSQAQPKHLTSTGRPSQRLQLADFPAAEQDVDVTVQPAHGTLQPWTRTTSFATSGPDDPHYVLDAATREIVFGPAIATPDGQRLCGRIPAEGADITARADTTLGARGNVPAHSLTQFAESWKPQPVPDAVVTVPAADYVFVGSLVASQPHTDSTTPPPIQPYTALWPTLEQFPRIDAGVELSQTSLAFFSGDSYLTLPTPTTQPPASEATPSLISTLLDHPGSNVYEPFARDINAALQINSTTVFLFKGPLVLSIPLLNGALSPPTKPPQQISAVFLSLPPSFTHDLSAATAVHGQEDTYHLFRGAEYVTVKNDKTKNVFTCTSPAHPSAELWPGMDRYVPQIAVTNPMPASGGSDPETFTELLRDTPAGLTLPQRTVTREDYERALREAVPGLARVICSTPAAESDDLSIRLIPELPAGTPPTAHSLTPSPGLLSMARTQAETLRLLGTRIVVTCPSYHRLHITASLTTDIAPPYVLLHEQVRAALVAAFHPLTGGRTMTGWPPGQLPSPADVRMALAHLPGTRVTGGPSVKDLDAGGKDALYVPVLDLLDLTINGVDYQDSLVLNPPRWFPPCDRSIIIELSSDLGRRWTLQTDLKKTMENGQWVSGHKPPPALTPGPPSVIRCAATDPSRPLNVQLTYQLDGTDENVRLRWTSPPAAPNTCAINTTPKASLALSSENDSSSVTVTGFRTVSGDVLPPSANSAHANLKASFGSKLSRSLTITLHDTSHDTWKLDSKSNVEFLSPKHGDPSTPVTAGQSVTFKVTTPSPTDPLSGSISCTPEGGTPLTLSWTATNEGKVTYQVDHETPIVAYIGDQRITTAGLSRDFSQGGGGLHATVDIDLKNTAHRGATVSLHNTLATTLQCAPYPSTKLENGNWTSAPPQWIGRNDTVKLSSTVDSPSTDMKGTVTYTYTSGGGREGNITLDWTSKSEAAGNEFNIKCPKGAIVTAENTPWITNAPSDAGDSVVWTLTKKKA